MLPCWYVDMLTCWHVDMFMLPLTCCNCHVTISRLPCQLWHHCYVSFAMLPWCHFVMLPHTAMLPCCHCSSCQWLLFFEVLPNKLWTRCRTVLGFSTEQFLFCVCVLPAHKAYVLELGDQNFPSPNLQLMRTFVLIVVWQWCSAVSDDCHSGCAVLFFFNFLG